MPDVSPWALVNAAEKFLKWKYSDQPCSARFISRSTTPIRNRPQNHCACACAGIADSEMQSPNEIRPCVGIQQTNPRRASEGINGLALTENQAFSESIEKSWHQSIKIQAL